MDVEPEGFSMGKVRASGFYVVVPGCIFALVSFPAKKCALSVYTFERHASMLKVALYPFILVLNVLVLSPVIPSMWCEIRGIVNSFTREYGLHARACACARVCVCQI